MPALSSSTSPAIATTGRWWRAASRATPPTTFPSKLCVSTKPSPVITRSAASWAEHGFEAATLARVVEAAGIPMSSVYHYYGSKDGILLAVMERGAERFFDDLPIPNRRLGTP